MTLISCFEADASRFKNFAHLNFLGTISREFTIERCLDCGQSHLKDFCKTVGYSRSGRWFYGAVGEDFKQSEPEDQELLAFLYSLPRLFYGGSAFGHTGKWAVKAPADSPCYQVLATAIWDPKYKLQN